MRVIAPAGMRKCVRRSALRKLAGRAAYRIARYVQWHFGGIPFARGRRPELYPFIVASHSTPVMRKLSRVDMWMQSNKAVNLRLAAAKLNGVVLMPGETFSFWRLVGKPTARRGYLPGMVLSAGSVKPGIGGGLCQMTNLIYWMALHTPLTVTERHRHSYDVFPDDNRTQPFGTGATCSYCRQDLQIHNGTGAPYQLQLSVYCGNLHGCWRSAEPCALRYEVYERDARILCNPWGGYIRHNAVWRRTYDRRGTALCDELIAENNALMMYQPYLSDTSINGQAEAACSAGEAAGTPVDPEPALVAFQANKNMRGALQSIFH